MQENYLPNNFPKKHELVFNSPQINTNCLSFFKKKTFLISFTVIGVRVIINFLVPVVILNIIIDFLIQSPIMVIIICIWIKFTALQCNRFCFFSFFIMLPLDLIGFPLLSTNLITIMPLLFNGYSSVEIFTLTFCLAHTGDNNTKQIPIIAKMMMIFLFMVINCYKYYLKINI